MVNDNYFERFQKKTQTNKTVDWIENSINKTKIKKARIDEIGELKLEDEFLNVVHIFKEKEGPDNGILYTYQSDGLELGDIIVKQSFDKNNEELLANREVYLLFEETPRVNGSVDIRVFSTIQMNVIVKESVRTYFLGYFKGEMRTESKVYYSLKADIASLRGVGLLIVPKKQFTVLNNQIFSEIRTLKSGDETHFSWEVLDKDEVTTEGMQYVTVKKILKEPVQDEDDEANSDPGNQTYPELKAGTEFEVSTNSAYFAANREVKVLQRKSNLVRFEVPITTGELVISVKNEDDKIYEQYYMVVI